jgi:hypothetical protein
LLAKSSPFKKNHPLARFLLSLKAQRRRTIEKLNIIWRLGGLARNNSGHKKARPEPGFS